MKSESDLVLERIVDVSPELATNCQRRLAAT
jgi:hypothetical protein